jgi:hypothetical protein
VVGISEPPHPGAGKSKLGFGGFSNIDEAEEKWDKQVDFDLFISQLVIQEASIGNAQAAQRLLTELEQIPAY